MAETPNRPDLHCGNHLMTIEIKICGLSTAEAMKATVEAGADHVGFIFFEKSPRNVSPQQAAELADIARNRAKIVAVTVNASDEFLEDIVEKVRPDTLQLHGSETPERVREIKARYGIPVMKAFAIRDASDLQNLAHYSGIADCFLLDAKAPAGSDLPGGNGVSFDWNLLKALDSGIHYMLSGGLGVGNIIEALGISGATAIDISSGVEAAPGVKDIAKIAAFIKTVRDYEKAANSSAA